MESIKISKSSSNNSSVYNYPVNMNKVKEETIKFVNYNQTNPCLLFN